MVNVNHKWIMLSRASWNNAHCMMPEIIVGVGLSGASGIVATLYLVKNLDERKDAELSNKTILSEMKLDQSLQQGDGIEADFIQFFETSGSFSIGAIDIFECNFMEELQEKDTTIALEGQEVVVEFVEA